MTDSTTWRMLYLACACVVWTTTQLHAQRASVGETVQRMRSEVDSTRMHAFYEMIGRGPNAGARMRAVIEANPGEKEAISAALIAALARANRPPTAPPSHVDAEAFAEYHGDLIWAVSELHDQRAIPALMGALETGGLAQRAIASFGPRVIPELEGALRAESSSRRVAATMTLVRMVGDPKTLADSASRSAIRDALLRAFADEDRFVRQGAMRGLGAFSDSSVTAALRDAGANDPWPGIRTGATALLAKRGEVVPR